MTRNAKKTSRRPNKKNNKNKTSKVTNKLSSVLETVAQRDYVSQLLHPFDTNTIQRGPFSGQPTGVYKMYAKGTLTVPASGFVGIIATPYYYGAAVVWAPPSIIGSIVSTDFNPISYGAAASVVGTYYGVRPLAGGVKVTAMGTPNTVSGTMYIGLMTPGQAVIGTNYSAFLSTPGFRSQHSMTPGESLFEVDTGVGQVGPEYRVCEKNTATAILQDAFYAFPTIFIAGAAVGSTYTYEATFLMEGITNGLSTGFTDLAQSRLTLDDWQRALMTLPLRVGSRMVRSGTSALTDGVGVAAAGSANLHAAQHHHASLGTNILGAVAAAVAEGGGSNIPQAIVGNMARYAPAYLG